MKTFFFRVNSKVKSDLRNIITEYSFRTLALFSGQYFDSDRQKKKRNFLRVTVSKIITRDKNTGESSRKEMTKTLFVYWCEYF